jgi:EpsI family protein
MPELTHAVLAACLMMAGSLLSLALTPTVKLNQQLGEPRFVMAVPAQIGAWGAVEDAADTIVDPQTLEPKGRKLNTEVLKRSYSRPDGARVMMLLAYAPDLSLTLQAYRPDACFPAQGWAIQARRSDELALPQGSNLPLLRMVAERNRSERQAVSSWQLIGTHGIQGAWHAQLLRFHYSSRNLEPDGLVMRVSSPLAGDDSAAAYALHDDFIRSLFTQIKPDARVRLMGLSTAADAAAQHRGAPVRH